MSVSAMHNNISESTVGASVSPIPTSEWHQRSGSGSAETTSPNLRMERPYLRARRRVRQRVDAGEPRNSYSSIPGYSFRSSGVLTGNPNQGPLSNGGPMASHRQQFFAAAAAAQARANAFANNYRMPGHFPSGPNNNNSNNTIPTPGRLPFFNDAFFRPPYHFGMLAGHKSGEMGPRQPVNGFPFPPGGNGSHLQLPHQHRPPFFPRLPDDFSLRHNGQACFNQFQNGGNNSAFFASSIAGDIRAGMARAAAAAAALASSSGQEWSHNHLNNNNNNNNLTDDTELDKTIEAESCEFSSSIEEFERKEEAEAARELEEEKSRSTVRRAAKDGQENEGEEDADQPINGAERERKNSRRKLFEKEENENEVLICGASSLEEGEEVSVLATETTFTETPLLTKASAQEDPSTVEQQQGASNASHQDNAVEEGVQQKEQLRGSGGVRDGGDEGEEEEKGEEEVVERSTLRTSTPRTPQVEDEDKTPFSPHPSTATTTETTFVELPSSELDVILDNNNTCEESSHHHSAPQQQNEFLNKFDITNNNNTLKSCEDTRQGVFLRELLHGKLALAAAAAAVAHRQRGPSDRFGPPFAPLPPFHGSAYPPPPFCSFPQGPPLPRHYLYGAPQRSFAPHRFPMMEPTLLAKSGDYASSAAVRHNNNELKDSSNTAVAEAAMAATSAFMTQLFKMRQDMALNMSMDAGSSASEREDADNELMMDEGKNNNNDDEDLEEEEELEEAPMDLQKAPRHRTSTDDDGRHSAQSDVDLNGSDPRSPSSDAGLSVSSSGKDASTKSARLEHIVNSMRSSPHPAHPNNAAPIVNGCKKRKLYQPVQHESRISSFLSNDNNKDIEETDFKKKRNDENEDPDMDLRSAASLHRREKQSATDFTNPLLNGPLPPPANLPPALQVHYMEMARRFIQEQQDKLTKEAITKEILNDTINKNTDIADRIAAISPELKGLADVLKSEIAASLTVIIDSIVGKFLHQRRQGQQQQHQQQLQQQQQHLQQQQQLQQRQHLPLFGKSFSIREDLLSPGTQQLPPPPALKQQGHTPSGRAPQVRDRSTPRVPGTAPLSITNTMLAPKVTNSIASSTSTSPFPLLPTLRAAPNSVDIKDIIERNNSDRASPYGGSSPSPLSRNHDDDLEDGGLPSGEQDEALSLVVTPKKRRHKVTDTRITPRTMSRVLGGDSPVDLHKQFGAGNGFFGMPKSSADLLSARTVPGMNAPPPPLFPGMPPPGFLPTSVAIPNPLADFAAFTSSFYSPPNPAVTSSAPTTTTTPPVRDSGRKSMASPMSPEKRHRDRHRSSGGSDSPLSHQSLLSRHTSSVDYAAQLREERNKEAEEFASSIPYLSGYGMNDGGSATLTPMHLRKAKLMFFWVRYPSSAILKMYFPDIKFNKNNTAQLVKWFSNFREFYYIQMEKYARQALSEGAKSDSELHVTEDSELYRVLNVHYNRNNHIEVPEHFLPVLNVTLREFFNSVQAGKDAESSWKKQIYKIIARFDEQIPDYFKTPEFLKQLE